MNEVVIVGAVRTPIGILNGGLSSLPAHELGAIVIEEALVRTKIDPAEVSDVIMGQQSTRFAVRVCVPLLLASKQYERAIARSFWLEVRNR